MPVKIKLTFDQFREKWEDRLLCEHGGMIKFSNSESELHSYGNRYEKIITIVVPSEKEWEDANQRRWFYNDAKRVGVIKMSGKKNIWYKTIRHFHKIPNGEKEDA